MRTPIPSRYNIFRVIPRNVDRWTYRYENDHETLERHGQTLKELLHLAVDDLEQNRALPVCIKADGIPVLDVQDIAEAWEKKYLNGEGIPY